MRLLSIVFMMLALLSGCRLVADKPLLDAAVGEAVYGEGFLGYVTTDGGAIKLSDDTTPDMVIFEHERGEDGKGAYVMAAGSTRIEISFHALPDQDFHLVQVTQKEGGAVYGLARALPDRLDIQTVSLGPKQREALATLGYAVSERSNDTLVGNVSALDATVDAYIRSKKSVEAIFRSPAFSYVVAHEETDVVRTMGRLIRASCLALAGHPLDPAMIDLPPDHRAGFGIGEINVTQASPVCKEALGMLPGDHSVRYANARILSRKEDWKAFDIEIEALRAADFGLGHAFSADTLMRGTGREVDTAAARAILEAHADDHPVVEHFLAFHVLHGNFGEAADPEAAAALFASAMRKDFAPSGVEYGKLVASGQGVKKDERAALGHFRDAARLGNGSGAMEAGRAFYFGTGVTKDHAQAFEYVEQAATARIPEAYYFAGFMSARGQGTTKNEKKAVAYLEKGAAKDNLSAKGELGRMLYAGIGVDADQKRGIALLREAAKDGENNAKTYLASIEKPLSSVTGIPGNQRGNLERAIEGKPFDLTNANIPFMAGVASSLMSNCGSPKNMAERTELAKFTGVASTAMIFGGDYSNRDLGKTLGSVAERNALQIAGTKVGAQVPCGAVSEKLAQGLLKAVRSNSRGADGGESRFVESCQRQFSARQCQCIADTGRVAIPDIHRQQYHRSIIKEMIQRNPMLGFTVGIACGVSNY